MRCVQCNRQNPTGTQKCIQCGAVLIPGGASTKLAGHNRYSIIRTLGKGGMGAIYLATETIAGRRRQVVIKEMLDYYDPKAPGAKDKARKRFESEAATLASLNVAGIPQIFDYFSAAGRNYIVMQFIEGQNLEIRLTHVDNNYNQVDGQACPVEQVRNWGIKLSKILEALAAQGIVHMDIKPANLILDKAGDIWLVDFGTAKSGRSGGAVIYGGAVKPKPQKSSVYGTHGYAPPEQVAGKPEVRSDVYALAATLYHLMTDDDPGEHPDNFPMLVRLPINIKNALERALATDVKQRITASSFRKMLEMRSQSNAPVFHWRDGTTSVGPQDLVPVADKKWEEALVYFKESGWENWLEDAYRNDLSDKLKSVKNQYGEGDLGLDAFLRILDPSYPAPSFYAPVSALDAGMLPWGQKRVLDWVVINQGSGCLNGKFSNLPRGVRVTPLDFATRHRQIIKVIVDSGDRTPSKDEQILFLTLETGADGKLQLPVKVQVPEPNLKVSTSSLNVGNIYPSEIQEEIKIMNQGGSEFLCEARGSARWISVQPGYFHCAPGQERQLKVTVDAGGLSIGKHSGHLLIKAKAGDWQQLEQVQLSLRISLSKVFWVNYAPPITWVVGWAIYGVALGWFSSKLITKMGGSVPDIPTSALLGAFIGVLVCFPPSILIGMFGGFSGYHGREGTRKGGILGAVLGSVSGVLSSMLFMKLLSWIGINLAVGQGLGILGGFVGACAGSLLGARLWVLMGEER